jgi:hypothetical protein
MALKKNIRHPSFIIGLLSFVVLILGSILMRTDVITGHNVILASVVLGAIHWIWSIADVVKSKHLDPRSRPFWIALVVIVPPLGGMMYYMMKTKNVAM